MAIPSGSGTEVIKHFSKYDHNSASQVTAITGVANHIYTVLSVIAWNTGGSTLSCEIRFDDGTNTNIQLVQTDVPSKGTFVFNDRFSFSGDVNLHLYSAGNGFNWHVTYIDQDWTT